MLWLFDPRTFLCIGNLNDNKRIALYILLSNYVIMIYSCFTTVVTKKYIL